VSSAFSALCREPLSSLSSRLRTLSRKWDVATGDLHGVRELGSVVYSVACGRDWIRDDKCTAAAMAAHARLGRASPLSVLDLDVLRLILNCL
jgi:hypothetical protein